MSNTQWSQVKIKALQQKLRSNCWQYFPIRWVWLAYAAMRKLHLFCTRKFNSSACFRRKETWWTFLKPKGGSNFSRTFTNFEAGIKCSASGSSVAHTSLHNSKTQQVCRVTYHVHSIWSFLSASSPSLTPVQSFCLKTLHWLFHSLSQVLPKSLMGETSMITVRYALLMMVPVTRTRRFQCTRLGPAYEQNRCRCPIPQQCICWWSSNFRWRQSSRRISLQ